MSQQLPTIELNLDAAMTLTREQLEHYILALEEQLLKFPQVEIPLKHYFSKGVYGREIAFPKGTLIVGKIHRYQAMNVLSKGEVSVLSIDGVMRFKAPHTFVSSPGAKRVIFAHEDSVWSTFHATDETDIEKIEEQFIAKSFEELTGAEKNQLAEPGGESCPLSQQQE